MAITVFKSPLVKGGWWINCYATDATGGEELHPAPSTGKALAITRVMINLFEDTNITIGGGLVGNGVMHPVVGPMDLTVETLYDLELTNAIILPEKQALVVDTSLAKVFVLNVEVQEVDV